MLRDSNQRPSVLVTGASGFLGFYIMSEMKNQGWNVVGLDREWGRDDQSIHERLIDRHTVELPSDTFDRLLVRIRPDMLIHAAGPASVGGSITNPFSDFQGSSEVFFRILDSIRNNAPQCKVIFLSSAAIYGNPRKLPVNESAPLKPISPYGYHKLICEKLTEEFYFVYGIRTCSVRIFSAYGPGLQRQVIWDICKKALHQPVIELQGTGQETRDFIHAQDVAQGLGIIAERASFQAEVYNLSTGEETSIGDLAHMLVAAIGRNSKIKFTGKSRAGDPFRWRADIHGLLDLGYHPRILITDGIKDYVSWFLKNYETIESLRS